MNIPPKSPCISVSTSIYRPAPLPAPRPTSQPRRAAARMPGRPPPPFGAAIPRFPLMSRLHFSVILCNPPLSSAPLLPPPPRLSLPSPFLPLPPSFSPRAVSPLLLIFLPPSASLSLHSQPTCSILLSASLLSFSHSSFILTY